MMSQPASTTIDLRPIPGPDPVVLSINTWWLWGIPIVLIASLWIWWKRPQRITQPTGQDLLYLALEMAEDKGIEPRLRFEELHHALRAYLAYIDDNVSWQSMTAGEALPFWQKLFSKSVKEASAWNTRWQEAEKVVFGPEAVTENQVTHYARHINELELALAEKNEK